MGLFLTGRVKRRQLAQDFNYGQASEVSPTLK
jgi:hypothetical protein